MADNEKTGKKAASNASKVLRDPKSSTAAKSAAGSALSQAPDRRAGPEKPKPGKKHTK